MLLLASRSPQRSAILRAMGVEFRCVPSEADEITEAVHFSLVPFFNAARKAACVSETHPEDLVLGADTVIEFKGMSVGKPRDAADAEKILMMLSGKAHSVVTAVCLMRRCDWTCCTFCDTTEVRFKAFGRSPAREYVRIASPLDKAGAYAIQQHGDLLVESIYGSYDNVVGLPSEKLATALKTCGNVYTHLG